MSTSSQQSISNHSQRRLGEYFQAAGLLNAEQLGEAIEYQCLYGGKLGTSLIELGLIDENQLAKALSQQLKRHYIKPELLMEIPDSVLNLIPEKTALKYQIVPYHKDGNKLYVALNETTHLSSLDELSFQLGYIIIPLAIPEIRLILALNKHYGMLLTPRYKALSGQIKRRMQAARKSKSQPPPKAKQKPEIESTDVSAWPLLGDIPYAVEEQEDSSYFHEEPDREKSAEKLNLNLYQKLANAQDRDDIAKALLAHLKADFPNCGLMMVRKETVTGWLTYVENEKQPFEQIVISLQDHSVFGLVAKSRSHYLGPLDDAPHHHTILDYFSTKLPQDVLVIPFTVQDRIVCILYIQGDLDALNQHLAAYQNIAKKAEMSFKLLILKNKILMS